MTTERINVDFSAIPPAGSNPGVVMIKTFRIRQDGRDPCNAIVYSIETAERLLQDLASAIAFAKKGTDEG